MKQTVEQMNEAIAEFMGLHRSDGTDFGGQSKEMWFNKQGYREVDGGLKYHSDWNQLIPVIKKIKSMHMDILQHAHIMDYMKAAGSMNSGYISLDILKTHAGVYEFIQWYNNTLNKQQ